MIVSRACYQERGVALATALLFLLVVTVISITAANNSSMSLKMSSNMQDSYESFQMAEAGIYGTLSLMSRSISQDPFDTRKYINGELSDPWASATPHPLVGLAADPNNVNLPISVTSYFTGTSDCPPGFDWSVSELSCDMFRLTSEHREPGRARTRVELGIVRALPAASGK
ncbi:MAG: pilus assembly PilX N-terminal domain-containing protein [Halioglobus sp.]|nr:pilus assembly PilX N-terminal domain-containing protein [Halioglobus sp.]